MAKSRINKPNFTQIPNVIFDEYLSDMGEAELKVMLFISRKTFGWHKGSDKMSLSQFVLGTGLSRQSVINGISAGIKRGTINKIPHGNSFLYSLNVGEQEEGEETKTGEPWSVSELYKHKEMGGNSPVCVYCGSDDAGQLDHWLPVSKGGASDKSNLVRACSVCNYGKSTMTGEEFVDLLVKRGWIVNDLDGQKNRPEQSKKLTKLVKQVDTQKKYLNKLTKEILSPVGDQAQTPAVVTGKTRAESLHHQTIDFISRVHHKVHGCPVVIDPKEAAHVRQIIKIAEAEDPENPKAVIERRLRICLHKMETATTDYWADFKFTPSKIRSRWNELTADLPKVTAAEKAIRENELRINDVPAAEAVDSIEEKNRRELLAMFAEAESNVSA